MRRLFPFLALFVALTLPGAAATYYVAPAGSDTADGSASAPLKSLARAAELAGSGDTVFIADGIYRETLAPRKSGNSGAPVIFAAAPGATPVITGCDLLTGWTKRKDGLWEAPLAHDLGPGRNQLFRNGSPLTEARYPKKTSEDPMVHDLAPVFFYQPESTAKNDKKPSGRIALNGIKGAVFESGTPDRWAGALFFGHGFEAWAFQCARVASSKGDHLAFEPSTKSHPWFDKPGNKIDPTRTLGGEGEGFIFGVPACLDAPGEWVLVDHSLRLVPPNGFDAVKDTFEARQRPWAVNLNGKNHIILRGLRFVGGAVRIKGNSNTLENCASEWGAHFLNYKNGFSPGGGESEGVAITIDGMGNVVKNCQVARTAGAGILLFGSDNRVTRCLVEDVDYAGTYGASIEAMGSNQEITFNTIRRVGRNCIQLDRPWGKTDKTGGHRIFLNDVSLPGRVCKDCGLIYTWGTDAVGPNGRPTRIAYNWFHDYPSPAPSPGIYLDNYTCNYLVDHNVIWNVPNDAGIRLNAPGRGNRILNNTLFRTMGVGKLSYNEFPVDNPDPSFWTSGENSYVEKNNLFLADAPASQLRGPDALDFSLKPGAPAISGGEFIQGISEAPDGKQPDLGACQTGLPSWHPGREGSADHTLLQSLGIQP